MSKAPPKLEWERLAQMPETVLLRSVHLFNPDDLTSTFTSSGCRARQTLPVRVGSISRDGDIVTRTFTIPLGAKHAMGQSTVHTYKLKLTAEHMDDMLEGRRKAPAGFTRQMLTKQRDILREREAEIAKNKRRMAEQRLLKLARQATRLSQRHSFYD